MGTRRARQKQEELFYGERTGRGAGTSVLPALKRSAERGGVRCVLAWEAVNVHMGTRRSTKRILADLDRRTGKQLRTGVEAMAEATIKEWKEWKKTQHHG
jgi:hypothetical protein